ncbi:hypothetical protein HN51_024332 [Arachis hypogaea]|uniref:Uncharacterized protein n=2 Tax=Arachis TaxID=3817 RepID=A0A445C5I6_ARAHY|nr:uncharacterized protein LOC107457720 [Arachis duranensis]XP_025609224.1 uncharacterized protein LOC112702424 [Arachis hypogaea]QHO27355.1 uncharacterized protein DS421_7g207350 [Arachis hypogaea]RYR46215.1 hypothetical protein Ahy_A07g031973 [Arachis hypogaea]
MASRVSPNSNCWQLRTPCSLSHSWKAPRSVPSLPLASFTRSKNSAIMPCRLVHGFTSPCIRNLRVQRENRVCCIPFHHAGANHDDHGDENEKEMAFVVSDNSKNREVNSFFSMKPDLLEPSLLGIQPEPPSWPEREEILRLSFERRVKGVGIPFSIRMIRKKLQLQKSLKEASDLSYCSVNKAFSSMLFIFHQLQNYALQTRESMFLEDFEGVMDKLRVDMDTSFVWLFQQVFCKTPTLMVDVMVLLANFSVFSMAQTPPSMVTNILPLRHSEQVGVETQQDEHSKDKGLAEEEMLWRSMVEEASIMHKGLDNNEVLDHETMKRFVSPLSVELQSDQYEEYVTTDLYYQKHLRLSPHNSLLLSNYGHFLFLVARDIDRSEEYYRRSVLAESPEAEAFSRYADFLWMVRKDLWAAELRYLQSLEAEPGNTYYMSKYASFLWNTGGQDNTSFPLEEIDNLQL